MANQRFSEKVAVVTGGGSGIGRSIATGFAKEGARVVILELSDSQGVETRQKILELGGEGVVYACDIANQQEVINVASQIIDQYNRVDILVNNAGISHVGNLEKTREVDMDRLYQVNVKGVYNGMYAFIEQMVAQGEGVILNLAAVAAKIYVKDRFAYSMSKGAVISMTHSVAGDYVKNNIRCNCICPAKLQTPFVDTFIQLNYPGSEGEMFKKMSESQPMGRMGKVEEVANLALFLCSDEASFITGCAYDIDGGAITLK